MDKFIRKKVDIDKNKPILFQVREWYSGDIKQDDDADSEDEDSDKKFQIYMFGVTQDGNTVCINIKNFKAFFYLKVKSGEEWNDFMVKQFKGLLKKRLGKNGKYLTGCKLLFRKDVYGFNNHKKFAFLKLSFSNLKVMSGCKWVFRKKKYKFNNFTIDRLLTNKLYNANLDPILTFVHRNDILTAGWVEVTKYQIPEISMSRCQIYAETSFKFVVPYEKEDIAPMVTLSFDIECMSTRPKKFPDPTIKGDAVIQIGSSFQKEGEPEIVKHVITLGPCDPIEGVIVEYYDTEAEVLEAWCELIKATDPDQLIGYNIFGFDWVYLWKRAVKVGCEDVFSELSRLIHVPSKMAEKQMSSNAYGHNEFIYLDMHGVGQIDLLHIVRREHKLTSYKLDNVASVFLGDKKHDVTPEMIFKMAGPEGTSAERAVVASYCAQDTALPLRLMKRLSILPNLLEMAKITRVPVFWLIVRGQQIKVFSQLVYEGGKDGFLVPTLEKKKKNIKQDKFVGATVLSAERGAYFEPVSGLDFASLYPSIMIAHNLCFSTFVMKEKYDNIKDVKYLHKKWEAGDYKFAQNVEGLLPKMLKKLWAARKVAKKQMKNAPTPELKAVYNGKQLAIKVSMNSIYGFTGASTGMLPCKPIASTTTTIGRGMIQHSKDCAESWYDGSEDSNGVKAHVVYGDSVTGDTPILLLKPNGERTIMTIESINNEWEEYNNFKPDSEGLSNKEKGITDYKVWSRGGWNTIKKVIRHKTNKKIYRVNTHCGCVDVTEDHSLINDKGIKLKPKECEVGVTKLFQKFPDFEKKTLKLVEIVNIIRKYSNHERTLKEKEAFLLGMFCGDGSCGFYNCKSGDKYSWAINNQDNLLLEQCRDYAMELYDQQFKILETMKSSGVNKLVPKGSIKKMVELYRPFFYDNKRLKKIPDKIINGSYEQRLHFFIGYYAADGAKCENSKVKNICFSNKGKIGSSHLYYLVRSLGYEASIRIRKDKPMIYHMTCSEKLRKHKNILKKIEYIGNTEQYVYDLETIEGSFHAGVGEIIVSNTDSIYTKFTLPGQSEMDHETLMKEQFRVATECAERISETFIKPIELEMEKVMYPFLLFSKKRYACLYYEIPEKPKGIDCKGIQVVRRDNCPLVKDVCNPVLDKIMYDKDIPGAEKIASDGVKRLLENKVPIEKLVLSKTLKKGYRCSVCHALDTQHYCKECLETYRKEHNNPNIKKENPDFLEYCWKNCKCEEGFIGSRLVTASMISKGENKFKGINEEIPVDIRHYHKLKMINYKPVINLPHVGLAKRMYKRDPMTAPQPGERVQYMFIENSDKNALQADRVENPVYAAKNPGVCKPDVLYYLERQLQSPLITLFELIVTDKNGKKFPDTPEGKRAAEREVARRLWKEAKRKKINALNGNQDIRNFFKLK